MTSTRIAVVAGRPRAAVDLTVGALAPRLISRDDTRVHVAVGAAGMVLLGGDHVRIDVDVGAGCTLTVEDVGGTVAYPGDRSSWTVSGRVGAGGVLVWHGLPFVVAGGAVVERRSTLTLGAEARAVVRETIVWGRHGERGGRVASAFSVVDGEGPILVEQLDADGESPQPGILGGSRVVDAVIAVGFRPAARPGVLELERPGALARHLATHTHSSPLDAVLDEWSRAARGWSSGTAETEQTRDIAS